MYPASVSECVRPYQRSLDWNRYMGHFRNNHCCFIDFVEVQGNIYPVVVKCNCGFVEICVACPFSKSVQAAFELSCADKITFNCCGCRHAKVVMAMDGDGNMFWKGFINLTDERCELEGSCSFDGIRKIDCCCASFHYFLKGVYNETYVVFAVAEVFN